MKKAKKVLSLSVAALMAFSTSAVTAFTASAETTDTNIYFEVPTDLWADAMVKTSVDKLKVYAHTYAVSGDPDYVEKTWQSRGEVCTYVSDNVYSYNIDTKMKTSLKDGADYVMIFSIVGDKNYQTCNVTMGKPCYGDTIVVTGETYENSVDSQKKDYKSVWKSEANAAVYGPKLEITSTGRVVGESIPTSITAEQMVVTFLHSHGVTNASILTPESVQATCANEFINVDPKDVYNLYVDTYADELADPETYPNTASAEAIAEYLGVTPEAEATYVVAGSEELCGVLWKGSPADAPENVMTSNGDGTFTKVFTDVQPVDAVQIKVVENAADGSQNWIGDETGNNITFNVTTACDVTVTFDSATQAITVTGEGVQFVTELEITSINAVGNGDPEDTAWLNGVAWDPAENAMTEVSEKVYEITFSNVTEYDNYQVQFAANGAWTDSWGAAEENFTPESGVAFDAAYNGENLVVAVPYELADVTLRIDLTNFDYATKTGAVATVTVTDVTPEEPKTIVGDVDGNQVIDANDVTALQMYIAKYTMDYEVNVAVADVDGNGTVNVLDVTALQKYVAGGFANTGNAGNVIEAE